MEKTRSDKFFSEKKHRVSTGSILDSRDSANLDQM
jgi:hypothetical protein